MNSGIDHSVYQDLLSGQETAQLRHIRAENQIVTHNFKTPQKQMHPCALQGCEVSFELTLLPNQWVYPKYCPKHRSEFRRQHFLEQHAAAVDPHP